MINGINFGNHFNYTTIYPTSQVASDLSYLKNYIQTIRIALPQYDSPVGIANAKQAHLDALSFGIEPFGGVTPNTTVTNSNWNTTVLNPAITWSRWCRINGINRMEIANELRHKIDGSSITPSQLPNKVIAVCDAIKSDGYLGKVAIAVEGDDYQYWSSLGSLDEIHINNYGGSQTDLSGFRSNIQQFYNKFGTKVIISEWGIFYDWSQITLNAVEQMQQVSQRLQIIKDVGINEHHPFTYRLNNDDFAFKLTSGKFRSMWFSVIENKNIMFKISKANLETARSNPRGFHVYKKSLIGRGKGLQRAWTDEEIDYLLSSEWAEYAGDIINNTIVTDGV